MFIFKIRINLISFKVALNKVASNITLLSVLLLITSCSQSDVQSDEFIFNESIAEDMDTKDNALTKHTNIEIWPTLDFSNIHSDAVENKINDILSGMSLEQKVAQMIQPEIRDFTVEDMRRYGFGSFLNGGGSFPNNNKHASPKDWVQLAEDMYQASIDDSIDGSTIPAIWGTDAVHGHNNVIGATLFPHNIGLGAANNPSLIEKIAQITAQEVMATGIDWVFAPTVAVVRNDRWGRTYEGYSEDPKIVKEYSASIVKGLQGSVGNDFLSDKRVISTIKHFLGDGGTQDGIDQGNNTSDEQTLLDIHAQGYIGGLNAGAQTVMASFNSWHGKKLHGHKYLLTDVLKNKIGFDGFVVGDWLGHGQIKGCTNYDCPETINAGLDVYMASGDSWKPLMENTIAQVKNGEISESRINDAVSRILRVKLRAGIFDKPSPANRPLSGKTNIIGSDEHRTLARQAVRESLVLLKNNNNVLPINPSKTIMLAGDAADKIGKQSGGWTITWQGTNNTNEDFPGASSVYDGFTAAVTNAGGKAFLSIDGSFETKPDVAVVVFGEEPYAEGVGDVKNVNYQQGQKTDLALLKKLKAAGIPTVSVFISGRPLYVNAELNESDAFVAAWLPGTEGNGISDVLVADIQGKPKYNFNGRLSFSWPASPYQTQINIGDTDYAPLLPLGFGLNYSNEHNQTQVQLSNKLDVEIVNTNDAENLIFFRKSISAGYKELANSQGNNLEMTSNVLNVKGLMVHAIDKDLQEDARQLIFDQSEKASYVIASEKVIDLTDERNQALSLFLNLRIDSTIKDSILLSMQCQNECKNSIDLSNQLKKLELNKWQELNISLACLEKAGVSLSEVIAPFQIKSKGELTISFSEISIKNIPNVDQCQ